ncbi:MAG: response regulator [Bacteroidota bacterium]|nr:response regulator [Bacteroidota bacterium]MDP3556461.1 response regulator [Bacteroidota bacterium]
MVDDDDRNIFALSAVLKSKGPNIIIAKDGIECLDKLRSHDNIDLVLLDMMMPVMDGYLTLKEMRNDEKLMHIPVISLTAQAMKGDRQKCIDAGASEYCSKPVDINILMEKISCLLNL